MSEGKEHELDRIANQLGQPMYLEVSRAIGLWACKLGNTLKGVSALGESNLEAKDALLAKLRSIVGPDSALTERIAELEKENFELKAQVANKGLRCLLPDTELVSLYEYDKRVEAARQSDLEQAERRGFEAARERRPGPALTFNSFCYETFDDYKKSRKGG